MRRPAALTPVRLRLPVARVERAVLAVGHAALGAVLGRWLADGLRHGPVDLAPAATAWLTVAWPVLPVLAAVSGLWLGRCQALALLPPTADGAWLERGADGRWCLRPTAADSTAPQVLDALHPVWDLGSALLLQAREPLRWLWLRRGPAGDAAWHALRLALRETRATVAVAAPREDR